MCVGVQAVSKEQLAKDPHAPKINKTPFNFFSVDARQKAKESYPELTQTEVTKKVSHHSSLQPLKPKRPLSYLLDPGRDTQKKMSTAATV